MRALNPDVILGETVHDLRLACGREVAAVAKAVGWPPDRLVALEQGAGNASFTEILPLAQQFGLSLEAFASEFQLNLAESRLDLDLMDEGLAREFGSDLQGSFRFDD